VSVHANRAAQVRLGVRVEVFTVLWMVVEAVVSIGAGIVAGSALLTAFGMDSVIELVSGGILLWRLAVEARGEHTEQVEYAEQSAAWVVAIALVLLCLYVLLTALAGLITRARPESSLVGIIVAAAAVVAWHDETSFGYPLGEWSLTRRCSQFIYLWVYGSNRAPWNWPERPLPLVVGRACGSTDLLVLAHPRDPRSS
jgi:hypothetical protein